MIRSMMTKNTKTRLMNLIALKELKQIREDLIMKQCIVKRDQQDDCIFMMMYVLINNDYSLLKVNWISF